MKEFCCSLLTVLSRLLRRQTSGVFLCHDDVIKWKPFPRYWPFVRGIHRLPVNSPHNGHWRGTLMFSLICAWINGSVNNREAGDLRRHRAHYDVIVMVCWQCCRVCCAGRPMECFITIGEVHKRLSLRLLIHGWFVHGGRFSIQFMFEMGWRLCRTGNDIVPVCIVFWKLVKYTNDNTISLGAK